MRRSILYVDDETMLLRLFEQAFGDEYDVRTFSEPGAALEALREFRPDIIISDQNMPGMEGTDVLREASVLSPGSFRILMTGFGVVANFMPEIGAGSIQAFVAKPWDIVRMEDVLRGVLAVLDGVEQARVF